MLFKITKASDLDYECTKEFNSIEEIRDFVKKENNTIYSPACVLYFYDNNTTELQVYDFWIE